MYSRHNRRRSPDFRQHPEIRLPRPGRKYCTGRCPPRRLAFKDSTSLSVFPLAPVQVVWIIMATSGMPDIGLGFERAVPDIL